MRLIFLLKVRMLIIKNAFLSHYFIVDVNIIFLAVRNGSAWGSSSQTFHFSSGFSKDPWLMDYKTQCWTFVRHQGIRIKNYWFKNLLSNIKSFLFVINCLKSNYFLSTVPKVVLSITDTFVIDHKEIVLLINHKIVCD